MSASASMLLTEDISNNMPENTLKTSIQSSDQPDLVLDSSEDNDRDIIINGDARVELILEPKELFNESSFPPHLQKVKPKPLSKKKRKLYNPNKSYVSSPTDFQTFDAFLLENKITKSDSMKKISVQSPDQSELKLDLELRGHSDINIKTETREEPEKLIFEHEELLSESSELPPHLQKVKPKPLFKKKRTLYNPFANKIFVSSPTEDISNEVVDSIKRDNIQTEVMKKCSLSREKEKLENTPITWLPIELVEKVFQYLTISDLASITQVTHEGWWINAWKTLRIWSKTSLTIKGRKSPASILHLVLDHFMSLRKLVLDGLTDKQLDLILSKVAEHTSLKELELRIDFLVSKPSPRLMAMAFHKMKRCIISYGILHQEHMTSLFHEADTSLESLEVDVYAMTWVNSAKFTDFVMKLRKFHLSCSFLDHSYALNALFCGISKSQQLKLQDLKISASMGNENPEAMADSVVRLNTVDLRTVNVTQAAYILTRIAELEEISLKKLTIEWCKHSECHHITVSPIVMATAVNKLVRVELFGQLTPDQFITILFFSTTRTQLEYLKIRKPLHSDYTNFTSLIKEAKRCIKTLIIYN